MNKVLTILAFLAIVPALALLLSLTGCVSVIDTGNNLLEHPKAIVSAPAKAGGYLSLPVGIAVSIVALPVTLAMATNASGHVPGGVVVFMPGLWCWDLGAICIGGPFWCLFGWWGNA